MEKIKQVPHVITKQGKKDYKNLNYLAKKGLLNVVKESMIS